MTMLEIMCDHTLGGNPWESSSLLLLIISYLVVVNECKYQTPKADNFVVDIVVVVALLVVPNQTIFNCHQ